MERRRREEGEMLQRRSGGGHHRNNTGTKRNETKRNRGWRELLGKAQGKDGDGEATISIHPPKPLRLSLLLFDFWVDIMEGGKAANDILITRKNSQRYWTDSLLINTIQCESENETWMRSVGFLIRTEQGPFNNGVLNRESESYDPPPSLTVILHRTGQGRTGQDRTDPLHLEFARRLGSLDGGDGEAGDHGGRGGRTEGGQDVQEVQAQLRPFL